VDCHLKQQEFIRLWHNDLGELVGYAMLGEDPAIDWQVLPEYEWAGIEAEALAWAAARLSELRGRDAPRWSAALTAGSREDAAARIAFLEERGFARLADTVEVNMVRYLREPTPAPAVPPGFEVRATAGRGECARRAAAQREVWRPWPVANVDGDDYARLMRLPGYHRHLDVVAAAADGTIVSYANCWIDEVNRIGHLGPVGTRPSWRRRGLARAVLLEGLRRLGASGMDRACVSTREANAPARQLYAAVGFQPVNRYLEYAATV